jgi:hypothetical protein
VRYEHYFHNCSGQYLDSISPTLYDEIIAVITKLPKRATQAEINKDLFWILTIHGWSYDSTPAGLSDSPPKDLEIERLALAEIKRQNNRESCLTSTTLEARWRSDFAKTYNGKLVQMEAQFGKVESMFKDFCGFKIAWHERRLALGIEIVMCEPSKYFSHRKSSTSGMAYFDIAKKTLPAIGLECPIWLLGIKE